MSLDPSSSPDRFDEGTSLPSGRITSTEVEHQRLKLALAACSIGSWDWDLEKGTIEWSEQVYKNFGLKGDETISEQFVYTLVHEGDRSSMQEKLHAALAGSGDYECEYRVIHPDGSIRFLESKGHVFSVNGKPVRMSGINIDVSDRVNQKLQLEENTRELKRKTDLLELILTCTPDGVVACDAEGRFLLFNASAEEAIGMGAVEQGPADWSGLYGCFLDDKNTPCPESELPLVRAIAGEEVRNLELYLRNPGKTGGVWIHCNAGPLRDENGNIAGGVNIIRDISDQKKAQELVKQRDAFVFTLVHDLKNGIAGSDISLNVLLSGVLGELNQKQQEQIRRILQSNADTWDTAQNLLRLYRYENAQSLDFRPLDLIPTIKDCHRQALNFAVDRKVSIELDVPDNLPCVSADRTAIGHVFANLIHNAVKFSPEGESVQVKAENAGEMVRVIVEDAGPGVESDERQKLFTLLSGESIKERQSTGTGLGLFLCNRIVEAHEGKISYQSASGGGSIFTVTLGALGV